jgi:autotransporter translocation and assembly factor TamB
MESQQKKSKKHSKKHASINSPVILERRVISEAELDVGQQRLFFNYFDDEVKKKPHKKETDIENVLKKEKKEKKRQRESMQSFAGGNHEQLI